MKLVKTAIVLMMMSGSVVAENIRISGTISKTLKEPVVMPAGERNAHVALSTKTREIKLLNVVLSNKAKQVLANNAHHALAHSNQFDARATVMHEELPSDVQLRMNQVPVLDQGNHGTCATFAVTAAINAVLNKGAYVSELCQLQVGNYLSKHGYTPSGWNGSLGRLVLSQMDSLGIISKEQQATHGCGGFDQYPTQDADPESSMNVEEYHQISEPLDQEKVTWWPILDVFQALTIRLDTNTILTDVKTALASGDRVMFGILLLDFDLGTMGAVGTKTGTFTKSHYDTWVLTPEIARDILLRPEFGGHAMLITGYDDNAVAIDDKGREYKGLLTLRNSWGKKVGDQGDFYMSYDYFKLLVLEAQQIHNVDDDSDDDNI